jgi:hypothetical protein
MTKTEMNKYSLDTMLDHADPVLQIDFSVSRVYPDMGDQWDTVEEKVRRLGWIHRVLEKLHIDDNGMTSLNAMICGLTGSFNEIQYFTKLEGIFNREKYYTYNSDNWFEVYRDDEYTRQLITEDEEND